VQVIDGCAAMAEGATNNAALVLKFIPPLRQQST
jgi:hypothetical protein